MKKMDPVVHFELPANDTKRMAKFFTEAFGWKTQFLGDEMGNYVTAATSETGKDGRPKNPGTINGGFYVKTKDMPAQHPSVVIGVDDINESIKKVKKAGGEVLGEPMNIPGIGLYVSFIDTEGNRLSILQPSMEMVENK